MLINDVCSILFYYSHLLTYSSLGVYYLTLGNNYPFALSGGAQGEIHALKFLLRK
jgi:hypothetical protein